MSTLDFAAFDADNHYYEATDAFTRHLDRSMARRAMQWAEINGKQRLVVAGRVNRFIPNPTFDPIARPGALDEYFRGKRAGDDIRAAFGDLEPISPAYREPEARLAIMDEQGIEGVFLFPTLGVGMEQALIQDPPAAHAAFEAFNRWLEDDWGYAYQERLFAAPYFTLLDADRAVAELDRVIANGVRLIVMRAGPVMAPAGGRSPGHSMYDPFWARANDAGITVAYHSGDSGYHTFAEAWGETGEMEAFRMNPFKNITSSDRPIFDTIAALICHGVFARHPRVRVASIESGSEWVPSLARKLKKAYAMGPAAFEGHDPVEALREHVWVSPYYEDDLLALRTVLGAERIIFGSDYPHAEGLSEPTSFVKDLDGFSDDEIRLVMHDNGAGLARLVA
jgi:predicted TIM-barrel fold metal-dependent hydrolase